MEYMFTVRSRKMSEKEQKRLMKIDFENQVCRISGQIGGRTWGQIVEEAERLNVKLLNPVFELSIVGILREEEEE
jgi:ribosomal protein L32E